MQPHDANSLYDPKFEDMLKEGSDPNPATSTDSKDEDRIVSGTQETYEDPKDRASGNMRAPWGEEDRGDQVPGGENAIHHGTGTWDAYEDTQHGVLDKAFDGKSQAAKADQAQLSQLFSHGSSGDFESYAPNLQDKSKITKVKHQRSQTLMTKVKNLQK